jgi:PAS domain S-box-containing protein
MLRNRRTFLRIVISAAILIAAAFTSYREIESAETVVKNQILNNAFAANRSVHILFDSARAALDTAASYIDIVDGRIVPNERLDAALDAANKSQLFVIGIIVLDADGNAVATAHPRTGLGVSYANANHFQALKNDPAKIFALGTPRYSQVFNQVLVPLARPIRDIDGTFLGVTAVGMSFSEIQNALKPASGTGDAKSRLWRDDGLLLASSENDQTEIGVFYPNIPLFRERTLARDFGTFVAHSPLNNETRISAWRNNFSYPVFASSGTNRAPAMRTVYVEVALIALAAISLLALVWVVAFASNRELRRREDAIKELRASRDQTQRSEDGLRRVLEFANDGIIILDASMSIRSFNGTAERIFGHRELDLLGKSLDLLLPADIRNTHTDLVRGFAAGKEQGRQMGNRRAVRGQHMDGHTIPLTIAISKAGAQSERLYLAIVRDVSEAVAYEARLVENAKEQEQLRVAAERASADAEKSAIKARRLAAVAEAASRAKTLMLARFSHEFRTPLNAVIGFSEMTRMGLSGPISDRARDNLGIVQSAGEHLNRMIGTLLDLSRIELSSSALDKERFDLNHALRDAVSMVLADAMSKSIQINVVAPNGEFAADFDPTRIVQVLVNLLSNAIRHSPSGGSVVVSLAAEEHGVVFRVEDRGSGIQANRFASIFEPFGGDDPNVARPDGNGLGLAISRQIMVAHGGNLTIENREGGGCCAVATLPIGNDNDAKEVEPVGVYLAPRHETSL